MNAANLNTRIEILKDLAAAEGLQIPWPVLCYIATATWNRRELEGALIRLVAYSSLSGEEMTLSLAREVIGHVFERVH